MSDACVVGLGRIGLPMAVQCASKGLRVVGCDIAPEIVRAVNAGECPYADEEGMAEKLRAAHAAGLLTATSDTAAAVREADNVVVVVPVGLTAAKTADFRALDAAAQSIASGLRPGTLVVLETTVPLGTTRKRLGAALEASGLRAGRDFYLAYSPERVFVGRVLTDLRRYPKVVGGIDAASRDRAVAFYKRALDAEILPVASCETAEMVKLAETTYRDVNIAFANELALAAETHGVDVTEAIAAANTQPFSHIHQPGVGVGGHCIPVYPHFLLEGADVRIPKAAREINDGMASRAVARLAAALGGLQGKTALILGLSYRPDIKAAAFSSAFALARAVEGQGAKALVHDPHYTAEEMRSMGLEAASEFPPSHVDALIVQAWHAEYESLDLRAFVGCKAVLDGRNALSRESVESLGMRYLGMGR